MTGQIDQKRLQFVFNIAVMTIKGLENLHARHVGRGFTSLPKGWGVGRGHFITERDPEDDGK